MTDAQHHDATAEDTLPITPEHTEVPSEESVATRCPYCDRPFPDARAYHLHVGERHPEACTDEEWAAYEEADRAERDDLFVYHLKAVVVIGVIWAVFVLLYMIAIGSGFL